MREIGKKAAETLLAQYDGKTFLAVHTYILTQSGNYGWQSDYSVDGKPVIRIVTDNAHQFSKVYDLTPAPAAEGATLVHA